MNFEYYKKNSFFGVTSKNAKGYWGEIPCSQVYYLVGSLFKEFRGEILFSEFYAFLNIFIEQTDLPMTMEQVQKWRLYIQETMFILDNIILKEGYKQFGVLEKLDEIQPYNLNNDKQCYYCVKQEYAEALLPYDGIADELSDGHLWIFEPLEDGKFIIYIFLYNVCYLLKWIDDVLQKYNANEYDFWLHIGEDWKENFNRMARL